MGRHRLILPFDLRFFAALLEKGCNFKQACSLGSLVSSVWKKGAQHTAKLMPAGTCTLLDQDLRPGSIVVATPGSLGCYTNYAYFDGTATDYSRTQGGPTLALKPRRVKASRTLNIINQAHRPKGLPVYYRRFTRYA